MSKSRTHKWVGCSFYISTKSCGTYWYLLVSNLPFVLIVGLQIIVEAVYIERRFKVDNYNQRLKVAVGLESW